MSEGAKGEKAAQRKRVPIREDFFTSLSQPLEQVRLRGCRCRSCGQAFLGSMVACENCQSQELEEIVLSPRGKLYTYTVLRSRPPGDYRGPEPFQPFAAAMVELPEGLSILAPLKDCSLDRVKVGMPLELVVEPLYVDAEGNEVISYKFRPVPEERGKR